MAHRHSLAALVFLAVLAIFGAVLWQTQVVSGAAYYETARQSRDRTEPTPAARGKLLDRRGRILAQDTVTWRGDLSAACTGSDRQRLRTLCQAEGVAWSGEGPVEGVTTRLMARVREAGLSGVTFTPQATRTGSGTLAPHLLGRVGAMSPEEWAVYQGQGYAMDAQVGKDGAEAAFEEFLHGTPGTASTDPQPGQDVTLTLDKDLQATARSALQDFLDRRPQATGGAVVALDVADGGVLALVSLPDYDTETFSADYEALVRDPDAPLMDRAIQGLYAPGSTFKLITATAALEEGCLTPETKILDTGRYTYYKSPQPQCWLYRQEGRTHGLETVSEALADSCNIFFYDAGRRVGIETLGDYARALGLGEKTGIELAGEQAGVVAGPAYSAAVGETWYAGSVLSAAIGQENNRFTPLQLAHMTATLASGGQRRQVHLLKKVGGEETAPVTLASLDLAPENLAAIQEGMRAAAETGALGMAFRDLPVAVGAKTGSAQVAGADQANAVLVCFAPYDDPQIALAIVAEQGGSGAALGEVAAQIIGEYVG